MNAAFTGSPESRLRAMLAMRRAPAVCEEDGPTMMGPMMSRMPSGFMRVSFSMPHRADRP